MEVKNNIYVLRHGESLEDVDKTAHERLADEDMPLSQKGISQAINLGKSISGEITGNNVCFYLSPSKRVFQTAELVASGFALGTRVEFNTLEILRKQNWGAVLAHERSHVERSRYETGVLRYDFPAGESAKSFTGRLSDFVRKMRQQGKSQNVVNIVITHGFEMRVILMHMMGWTEEYFESLAHPNNCEVKKIVFTDSLAFKLLSQMRIFDPSSNPNFISRIK